jgi:hypothetical protein
VDLSGFGTEFSLDLWPMFQGETSPGMSLTPEELEKLLDELEKSRASRKRSMGNLQEVRSAPERKTS